MICWRNNKGTSSGVTYPYLHSLVNNNSDQINTKDKETMLQRYFSSLKKKWKFYGNKNIYMLITRGNLLLTSGL